MKRRGWLWRARKYAGPEWLQRRVDLMRLRVAKSVLDVAEQLPSFNGGPVQRLQTIRKLDRELAAAAHATTRPPEGTSLSCGACCLLEVFPIEDFDHLESGVRRLFPRMEVNGNFDRFRASADDLLGGGWLRIGTLVPGNTEKAFAVLLTEEFDLPSYVKSVEVWGHRPLPSIFAISLHAKLTSSVTDDLVRVQSSHYLPDVRFWPMVPIGRRYRTSSNTPDLVALRALTEHQNHMRAEIEDCFAPFISGYFMKRSGKGPHLPATEIYELNGTGSGEEALMEWKTKTRPWCMSMALNFFRGHAFEGQNTVFTLAASLRPGADIPYKLLILTDKTRKGEQSTDIEAFLISVLPIVAIREFTNSIIANVSKARRRIYTALSRRRSLGGLLSDIGISRRLSREIMLLERLSAEMENGDLTFYESRLSQFVSEPNRKGDQHSLFESLKGTIDFQLQTVRGHITVMAKSFSEHLMVRNMALMYGLQLAILILSIVSIALAVTGTAANWDQIERLWQKNGQHETSKPRSTKMSRASTPVPDRRVETPVRSR